MVKHPCFTHMWMHLSPTPLRSTDHSLSARKSICPLPVSQFMPSLSHSLPVKPLSYGGYKVLASSQVDKKKFSSPPPLYLRCWQARPTSGCVGAAPFLGWQQMHARWQSLPDPKSSRNRSCLNSHQTLYAAVRRPHRKLSGLEPPILRGSPAGRQLLHASSPARSACKRKKGHMKLTL